MKKSRQIFLQFPEYYLVALVILAGYSPPFYFNPIFIGLAVIPILQIVFKNKISGMVLGSIFLLINLYMLLALVSEFNEFTEFNHSAKQLLFVGTTLWILNMLAAGTMIYKYSKPENKTKLEYHQ